MLHSLRGNTCSAAGKQAAAEAWLVPSPHLFLSVLLALSHAEGPRPGEAAAVGRSGERGRVGVRGEGAPAAQLRLPDPAPALTLTHGAELPC